MMSDYMEIKPEWIDHNGHLNMAYYGVLFDHGSSFAFRRMGFGPAYRRESGHTTFEAEYRIRYRRELKLGDRVRASFHLLDAGSRAIHYCQELFHEDGWVAATGEGVNLHIDRSGPRVAPYPPQIVEKIAALLEDCRSMPVPDWVGAPMGIRK
ncbi:thioesterase [Pseudooceanicola sp. 216_PA32_1]|uniref:Thioesterase n=2 Tax=Pseudooceanicola pacificus TaxID=2676438 RepID=A0A844W775_9RHOB|nr:thioesterase [Pseudooceanicola pacificus]